MPHWLEDYPANPLDFSDCISSDYEDDLFEWATRRPNSHAVKVAHASRPRHFLHLSRSR